VSRRFERDRRQRGITILEIMIVLAIIGLMMLVGLPAVRSMIKTDLRADANQVASLLRAGHELAALSGVHHRVRFNLDAQTFQLEACPEEMALRRSDDEELVGQDVLADLQARQAQQLQIVSAGPSGAEVLGAETPEQSVAAAAALSGTRIGGARCVPPTTPTGDADGRGAVRTLNKDRGVKFGEVHVQHLRESARTGEVVINFFPLGWSEKAVVEVVTEEGDRFNVLVHGASGRVETRDGAIDVDRHMRRSPAGGGQERER
jgi:prepilin-type N-terminal cleavage/methylation domain-containing protein